MNRDSTSYLINIVFFFLFIVTVEGFSQDTISDNGFQRFYYSSGIVSSEGTLKNGKPDGYWKAFYENGKLKSEGNRKDFELDSLWKFYNEEGKLILEVIYRKGKKNGEKVTYLEKEIIRENFRDDVKDGYTKSYYPDGKIKSEIPFIKGQEQGFGKEYGPDGTIITLTEYKKGFIVDRLRINRRDQNQQRQGKWYTFYPSGAIMQEGTYRNDLKNGFFKDYAENGDLIRISKYIDDVIQPEAEEVQKHEKVNEFYPDGKIRAVSMYRNGTLDGVRQEYDTSGTIVRSTIYQNGFLTGEGIFTEEGIREGFWKEYYPGGALRSEGSYEGGNQTGVWKYYHTDGRIEQEGKYNKKGQPEGTWKWYFETGELKREEQYRNGLRDGMLTEYDENGKILEEGEFVDGLEEGPWVESTGDITTRGTYREGLRHGMWQTYQMVKQGEKTDSVMIFRGAFIDDNADGKHQYFDKDGNPVEEGLYVSGRREGDWIRYNTDGTPFLVITYKNGAEIKYDGTKIKPPFEEETEP